MEVYEYLLLLAMNSIQVCYPPSQGRLEAHVDGDFDGSPNAGGNGPVHD